VSSVAIGRLASGRTGRAAGPPGLVVREVVGLRTASLVARRGAVVPLSDAVWAAFGVSLPTTPRAAVGRVATFVWTGPAQWLVEVPPGPEDVEALLAGPCGALAAITEQSDSRVVLELAGPCVRDVLAKGLALDLHPAAFGTGDVAVTVVAHVGVQLRQTSDAPSYRVAVVRSYFGSFCHWLLSSAAEYGCEVVAAQTGDPPGG
jgi:heterotetrameric sarcosine oxidase gamma subunit